MVCVLMDLLSLSCGLAQIQDVLKHCSGPFWLPYSLFLLLDSHRNVKDLHPLTLTPPSGKSHHKALGGRLSSQIRASPPGWTLRHHSVGCTWLVRLELLGVCSGFFSCPLCGHEQAT